MNSKIRLLPALAALLVFPLTAWTVPVSTAFNYQGRLDHNGAVANGLFDLKFEIYTEWTGGTPAVPAIEIQGLAVSGGLISADLDFGGATVFDGRAYYLQTYARQQGSPTYVLVPGGRTAIRPAPYSIHALSAASVKDGGVTSTSLASGAVTSAKLAASAVGLPQLNTAGVPASGQVLGYNGTGLSWMASASGPWLLNGANAYYNGGNVGIGTNNPGSKLTVFHAGYGFEQTDGTVRVGIHTAASSNAGFIGTRSNHPLRLEVNGSPRMTVDTDGNVGIGTSSPGSKLTVFATGYGFEQTDGTVTLGHYTAASHNAGFIGTRSNHKLHLEVNGSPRMTVATDGNVGIGTSSPGTKLTVSAPGYGIEHTDGSVRMGTYVDSRGGFLGSNSAHPLHLYSNNSAATLTVATNGNVGIGTTNPNVKLEVAGNIYSTGDASVRALTIRGGADLAEPFAMSHEGVEPGTVVVIDAENPGKLKASTRAYDKKVAGIVSGANGIQPGISMIQEDKLEAGENVALSGRVFVKADTSAGPIEPGDLLTTSSTAGHAMKAADHSQAQGSILGKAMTPLASGDGMVLVLVTLQ